MRADVKRAARLAPEAARGTALDNTNDSGSAEPPRDSRRLHFLRGWSHEHDEEVLTGGQGAGGSAGL
jgi:hypothetical protein